MLDAFKSIDSFPKALDDIKLKTNSGAAVSIIAVLMMILLFFSELSYFYKTETVDHLFVNITAVGEVTIDFDISFPEIACNLLSVDAYDDVGRPQLDALHEIYKHKLTKDGAKEGFAQRAQLGDTVQSEEEMKQLALDYAEKLKGSKPDKCGNCYGAGGPGHCCNTCQEVKDAYESMGWKFKPQGIVQCSSDAYLQTMKEQFAEEGGCQLYGRLALSRNAGRFHIAPHKKLHTGGPDGSQPGLFNLMDLISFTFDQFNVTHTMNSLSFGNNFPGISSPLDGQVRIVKDTHGMYQYYIKVVPTRYRSLDGKEIQSNQYAVTEHMSHLSPGSGRGLPGVYFNYEVSPVQAVFEEKRVRGGSLSFITSVCAIVGGVYTAMGVVDMFIGTLLSKMWKGGVL